MSTAKSRPLGTATRTLRRATRAEEPEWIVWLAVIAMLAIGLIVRGAIEGRTARFSQGGLMLSYPAGWSVLKDEQPGQVLHVADTFSPGQVVPGLTVRQMPASELGRGTESLGDLAMLWSNRQSQDLLSYSVLNVEQTKVRGKDAVALDYAYVSQPPGAGVPVVVRAEDILLRQADKVAVMTFSAASDAYESQASTWRKILASADLQ